MTIFPIYYQSYSQYLKKWRHPGKKIWKLWKLFRCFWLIPISNQNGDREGSWSLTATLETEKVLESDKELGDKRGGLLSSINFVQLLLTPKASEALFCLQKSKAPWLSPEDLVWLPVVLVCFILPSLIVKKFWFFRRMSSLTWIMLFKK